MEYWTISEGVAIRTGWSCRECKRVIQKGEEIKVRDGRKMRFFYHKSCFSGDADPRSQSSSSLCSGRFPQSCFHETAPVVKGRGKWSVEEYGYRASSEGLNTTGFGRSRKRLNNRPEDPGSRTASTSLRASQASVHTL
ncbi:uncharacterized protein BJ171DRAFT_584025 [Polychytrium aggregatum]|uniref:uncharacterized protein n=1 Tax=Polychytrium aggregatum TaxID=110093 RepID=UPI0022FEF565|nr:uncharacterized protein BJ171DRAFT_584025 [Polychytrium aggregatum]KAI9202606.1 hypothetical protein BJ171DRAFT_584025 [Polychytrium aggregatum]